MNFIKKLDPRLDDIRELVERLRDDASSPMDSRLVEMRERVKDRVPTFTAFDRWQNKPSPWNQHYNFRDHNDFGDANTDY